MGRQQVTTRAPRGAVGATALVLVALAQSVATADPPPADDEALDDAIAALDSADYQERMLACRAVRRHGPTWLAADADGSSMAAAGGSTTSKLLHFFDRALNDPSQNTQREALLAAAAVPLKPVWAHVKQVMQRERGTHVTAVTRVIAVQTFAEMSVTLFAKGKPGEGEEAAAIAAAPAEQLAVVLRDDPAPSVRRAAAEELVTLDDPKGVAILEEAFSTETNPVVLDAIRISLANLEGVCIPPIAAEGGS